MNYIFVGNTASGKSTAKKYLSERANFQGFECSDYVHAACRDHDMPAGEVFRKLGRTFVVKQILEEITDDTPFVISGCRKPAEIELMKKHYGFKVIHIYSSDKRCFQRHLTRKRDDGIKTFEDFFNKKILANYRIGLTNLIASYSDMMVDNDHDDLGLFYKVLREIVEKDNQP